MKRRRKPTGSKPNIKATSLTEKVDDVYMAFRSQFPVNQQVISASDAWIVEIFDDHVIIEASGDYYQVPYTREGDEDPVFAGRDQWVEVEKKVEWAAKSIRAQVRETRRNPLKSIGGNDAELRVANYIVLFGDEDHRDLEFVRSGANPDGSLGEFFSPDVEVESPYTKTGVLPLDWEHGEGQMVDGVGPDRNDVLGFVDWKTAEVDELGIWVERVLNRRSKYVQVLEEVGLIDAGLLGTSSEAIPMRVVTKSNGEIVKWPLRRDTLTVMPAEPRMMTQNVVHALKSLAKALGQPEAQPEGATTPASAASQKPEPIRGKTANGSKTMNKEQLLRKYAKALGKAVAELTAEEYASALEGTEWEGEAPPVQMVPIGDIKSMITETVSETVKGILAAQPAINGNPGTATATVTLDEADKPFEHEGDFFMAIKSAALNPGEMDVRLKKYKAGTGLNEANPSEGGFLLIPTVADGIREKMFTTGELLSRVAIDPIGPNSNSMTYNAVDETSRATGSRYGGIRGYWVAEGGSIPASRPKFDQVELKLKKVAAAAYATDELLADKVALRSWLTRTVPQELRFQTEDAVFEGDGVGKPLGFMNAPALVTVARGDANTIKQPDISNMWARRWAGVNDYVWLVHQDISPQLHGLVIGQQPIYLPPGGLSANPYGTLLGKPVIEVEYASSLGTIGDITLVSLSQYQMINKGEISAAESIHVEFLKDETVFRFTYRVDGQPFWKSPLTPFKGNNTQSPFVALSTSS